MTVIRLVDTEGSSATHPDRIANGSVMVLDADAANDKARRAALRSDLYPNIPAMLLTRNMSSHLSHRRTNLAFGGRKLTIKLKRPKPTSL